MSCFTLPNPKSLRRAAARLVDFSPFRRHLRRHRCPLANHPYPFYHDRHYQHLRCTPTRSPTIHPPNNSNSNPKSNAHVHKFISSEQNSINSKPNNSISNPKLNVHTPNFISSEQNSLNSNPTNSNSKAKLKLNTSKKNSINSNPKSNVHTPNFISSEQNPTNSNPRNSNSNPKFESKKEKVGKERIFRGIDERAEEFIIKFREQIQIQREQSIIDFQEMLKRSA